MVDFVFLQTQITTEETDRLMSAREKRIKARLGLLALARELDNVRLASRRTDTSRGNFYKIKQAYGKQGAEGPAPQPRCRLRMPDQTPPELEQRILEMTGPFPVYSDVRISGQLRLIGVRVSPSTVQAVWQRHGLTLRIHSVLWFEQKTAGRGGVLTERQLRPFSSATERTPVPINT